MSYQGGIDYNPYGDVDESIEVTEMQGIASRLNHQDSKRRQWMSDPTKSLLALWFFVVLTYWLLGYVFRRYRV